MIVDYATVRDTRDDARFEPLIVTAHLAEPIVHYEDGLHLDGPLQWAAYREWAEAHDGFGPLPEWVPDYDIPVARWTAPRPEGLDPDPRLLTPDGLLWGWCCSDAIGEWVRHGKAEVRKRPDVEALKRFSAEKTYNASLGPHKARDLVFPTVQSHSLQWHVLGDLEGVECLLERVHSLGKLRGHGHGTVSRWTVEHGGDRMSWMDRAMPAEGGVMLGIRAPYWHRGRRAPCAPRRAA